jgi:hypothetical protein
MQVKSDSRYISAGSNKCHNNNPIASTKIDERSHVFITCPTSSDGTNDSVSLSPRSSHENLCRQGLKNRTKGKKTSHHWFYWKQLEKSIFKIWEKKIVNQLVFQKKRLSIG